MAQARSQGAAPAYRSALRTSSFVADEYFPNRRLRSQRMRSDRVFLPRL